MRAIDPYAARLAVYSFVFAAAIALFAYYVWPGGAQ